MKRTILLIMGMVCASMSLYAQSPLKIKPLTIGDTVPDIALHHILNYKDTTAKLSDFRGKLVILDFWGTWCSACLANFPKMENLQQKFGRELIILGVTSESKKKIDNFFRSDIGKKYKIKSIVEDNILDKLFPHRGIPHCIWIDKNGIVKAITGADQVKEENIRKILLNQYVNIPIKKDLDPQKPLFLSEDFPAGDSLLYYSLFFKGYYNGLPSGNQLRKKGNVVRGQASTNSTILWIYEAAVIHIFNDLGERYNEKRKILHIKDTDAIILHTDSMGLPITNNLYNYDLIVPVNRAHRLYYIMLKNLNRYTNYYGRIEKVKTHCLALVRTSMIDKIRTKGGKWSNTLFYKAPYKMTNQPVDRLIMRLNSSLNTKLPIIDETNYKGNIDIHLSPSNNIAQVREELKNYDLDLIDTIRPLYMFILSDK